MRATKDFFNLLHQEIASTINEKVDQPVKAGSNSNRFAPESGQIVDSIDAELKSKISELEKTIHNISAENEQLKSDLEKERVLRIKLQHESNANSAPKVKDLQSTIQRLTEEKQELQQALKEAQQASLRGNSEQSVSVTSAVEFAENYIEQNQSCILTVRDFILYIFNPKEMPDELYNRIRNLGVGPRETVNMGDNNGIVAGGDFNAKINLTDNQAMMVADRMAGKNLLGDEKDGNNN